MTNDEKPSDSGTTEDEKHIRTVVEELTMDLLRQQNETGFPVFSEPVALVKSETTIARSICEMSLRRINRATDLEQREAAEQQFLYDMMILGATKLREKERHDPKTDLESSIAQTRDMLIQKNREYGSAVFKKGKVFSKTSAEDAIRIRLDDKMSRLAWMMQNPGEAFVQEDTEFDLTGYLILMQVARRKSAGKDPS